VEVLEKSVDGDGKRREETSVVIPAPGHHLPRAAMRVKEGGLLGSGPYLCWVENEDLVWDSAEQAWPSTARVFAQAGCS